METKLTDKRILGYCEECVTVMNELGYEIKNIKWLTLDSINTFGRANKTKNTVWLNKELSGEGEHSIKNVIYHELAHIASPLNAHHNWQWKHVCDRIRVKTGQIITRTTNMENHEAVLELRKSKAKYAFRCPECGNIVYISRTTAFVREYAEKIGDTPRWYCSRCYKNKGIKVGFERIK